MMEVIAGPRLTDYNGDLDTPVKTCCGCPMLRVHDFHYLYCRHQGDQSKPDFDPYNGGLKRVRHDPICGLEPVTP